MPFKSKAQETFLKINYPEIARKWVKESKRYNLAAIGLGDKKKKNIKVELGKKPNVEEPKIAKEPKYATAKKEYRRSPVERKKAVYKELVDRKVTKKKTNKPPLYKADDVARRDLANVHRQKVSKKNNKTDVTDIVKRTTSRQKNIERGREYKAKQRKLDTWVKRSTRHKDTIHDAFKNVATDKWDINRMRDKVLGRKDVLKQTKHPKIGERISKVSKNNNKTDVTDIVKDVAKKRADERFFDYKIKEGGDPGLDVMGNKSDAEAYRRWKKKHLYFAKENIEGKAKKVLKVSKKNNRPLIRRPGVGQNLKGTYESEHTEPTEWGGYQTSKALKFNTPEGERWYKGEGSSKDLQYSRTKADADVRFKAHGNPSDSLITGGITPNLKPPKKEPKNKKKKGKKKRFWKLKK